MTLAIDNLSYSEIARSILKLDKSITSVTIARIGSGKVLATNYKEEKESTLPLLTRQESELLTVQSLIRMSTRTTLEHKLGKVLYSSTVYENLTTASMYLSNHGRRTWRISEEEEDDDRILMLSFDNKYADHELIIKSKILPFLEHISETTTTRPPQVDEHQYNKKIE